MDNTLLSIVRETHTKQLAVFTTSRKVVFMERLYNLFNNKAALYAANRPGYSPHVMEYLQQELGLSPMALGADIGCGTGQLTKNLAEYFDSLYAVEPNASMMQECQKYLHNYKNILYVCSSAESTGIDTDTLDYVTVAQAFHLFRNAESLQELKRILKSNGHLIIIYNMKNHSSDLFLENEKVLLKYCPLYKRDFHATEFEYDSFYDCFMEGSYQYRYFINDNTEYIDYETFINRTLSASYAIQKENPYFKDFVKELATIFTKFSVNNKVKMELSTVIYSGCLR